MESITKFIVGTLLLTISAFATAEVYDVERFYASGENFIVTRVVPPETQEFSGEFDIAHHEEEEIVSFNFVWGPVKNTSQCVVGPHVADETRPVGHLYPAAVELAENIELIESFHVKGFGGVCFDLDFISYRTDIIKVEFNCDNAETYWGQSVYVVGSSERLGNWDTAKALKLEPEDYPHWRKSLVVENNQNIEWKCIKRDEHNPHSGVEWQPGVNNNVVTGEHTYTSGSF